MIGFNLQYDYFLNVNNVNMTVMARHVESHLCFKDQLAEIF